MVTTLLLAAATAAVSPSECPAATQASWSVSSASAAAKLGEMAAVERFGRRAVSSKAPYVAQLAGDIWHVYGTLPKGRRGGTPEVKICASNGQVLAVTHGR